MAKAPIHLYDNIEYKEVKIRINSRPTVERLDSHLVHRYGYLSRNYIQKLIREGNVRVNGRLVRPSRRLHRGDLVEFQVPVIAERIIEPEAVDLNIIYEDEEILVIDKPPNMTCHAGKKNHGGTLANAIVYYLYGDSADAGRKSPGIVHRLDKDTSGVMVVAKTPLSHRRLAAQFARRRPVKEYLAIVKGVPQRNRGVINAPIGYHPHLRNVMSVRLDAVNRKPATTQYTVLERFQRGALLLCAPRTGRTHQIRVHLESIGHPLYGEDRYAGPYPRTALDKKLRRQALHASRLTILHPVTEQEMCFEAEMPADMVRLLAELRQDTPEKAPHSDRKQNY